jgi:hypothetical protein
MNEGVDVIRESDRVNEELMRVKKRERLGIGDRKIRKCKMECERKKELREGLEQ